MTPETPTPPPPPPSEPAPLREEYNQLTRKCLLNHPWKVLQYRVEFGKEHERVRTGRIYHASNHQLAEMTAEQRGNKLERRPGKDITTPQLIWAVHHADELADESVVQ